MRTVQPDLWETRAFSPFPGVTTHAYLWIPPEPSTGNLVFYAPGDDAELTEIAALGGVAHQYLSHRDEAGPALRRVRHRFGSRLHAPAVEVPDVERHAPVDVPLGHRHVDPQGVEVVPTPGHTPGSTCYLVHGAGGTYLFTGDTIFLGRDGRWRAGYLPDVSDAADLAASLDLLATFGPDLVVSSAAPTDTGAHVLRGRDWAACVAEAREALPIGERARAGRVS